MKRMKIAVLGSDGSGKSTFLKYLKKKIENQKRTVNIFVFGWKDFQNPILRFFSSKYMKDKEKRGVKEEKLERFRSRSFFFYVVYYFELLSRYLKTRKSKAEFLLFDRYFYDELTFAKGLKYRFFRLITPKPDLCVILRVSPKVLNARGEKINENRLYR